MTNKLPDELVLRVFSSLDPLSIARVERTCQQWHKVARDNHHLWRDGTCIEARYDEKDDFDFVRRSLQPPISARRLLERINALRSRSGSRLDSLNLTLAIFPSPSMTGLQTEEVRLVTEAQDVARILLLLPQLHLRKLTLFCSAAREQPSLLHGREVLPVKISQRQTNALPFLLSASLLQCGSLTSLLLSTPVQLDRFGIDLFDEVTFRASPLASCRLQRFKYTLGVTALLKHNAWKAWLGSLTHLELNLADSAPSAPLVLLWTLLDNAKDTLEEVKVALPYRDGVGEHSIRERICLPRLTKLSIEDTTSCRRSNETRSPFLGLEGFLVCPALLHLYVHGPQPWRFFCDVLCRRTSYPLQSLTLSAPKSQYIVHTDDGIAETLNDRFGSSLTMLSVFGHDAEPLVDQLSWYPAMLLDNIEIADTYDHVDAVDIVELVATRFDSDAYRPIRRLVVCRTEPYDSATMAWLKDHVETFVYSDDIGDEEFSDGDFGFGEEEW